jgi:hypothetical protein
MKTPIAFLAFVIAVAGYAGEKKMVGSDVDYVATAMDDTHASSWQVRSTYFAGAPGLFAVTTMEIGERKWQEFAGECVDKIKNTLGLDGWTITYDMGVKPIMTENFQIMMTAKRGEHELQLLVAVFPLSKGKVNVAYTQTSK